MPMLCYIAARALTEPIETTIRALLEEYGLDSGAGLLVSLITLRANLEGFAIGCEPQIGVGDLDDIRVLSVTSVDSVESVLKVIAGGERADVEFKSSMLLDVRRYRNQPGEPLESYRLEAVTRAMMKSIAAFCNSGGGTLFVGVEDNTNVCGLAEDFLLANPSRGDFDGWDQYLRGQLESRFHDGKAVANYVRVLPLETEGKTFVRIQVADRVHLTFLKKTGGGAELFVRSGTRSIPIEFHDIEKHYSIIRRF
ncbi:ATP-binding protein [Sinorhizobium meliloti]|nr:ATP-binding protein [Sinorhizobium meliloti]RVI25030.1 ATP-binding protein [Sinorhizobium meliloti]RVI39829.1 ATP-binding protein [Sinorhizobium meliloti]RVJ15935.1 ATP-binding protein [Sinorhizobium meliloti]RVJ87706.1 ATP-binding protein [Sinorhizobium meliloti]